MPSPGKVGGRDVVFDQDHPVPFYLENFLDFAVGMPVPVGYYDNDRGVWVPYPDGRVIKRLGTTGQGLAEIDSDGDDQPDDSSTLTALGFTDAERAQVAQLYTEGETLWRVRLTHFSSWDCNWPGMCAEGTVPAVPDPCTFPNGGPGGGPPPPGGPCNVIGSSIGCETQTLGEDVDVTGTPYRLHYQSDRVPGRREAYELDIVLTRAVLPEQLARIELQVLVAGRRFTYDFSPLPNLTYHFADWDGTDAYGRLVQGQQRAFILIDYVYPAFYADPAGDPPRFALPSSTRLAANPARDEITAWQRIETVLGAWDARAQNLGGWTLDVHHAYSPYARTVFLGDGRQRTAEDIGQVIDTIAGTGDPGAQGDGGPAITARVASPAQLANAPGGGLYVADRANHRIRHLTPDGRLTTIAGRDGQGSSGDGGLATQAFLNNPRDVAPDALGGFYIADTGNNLIRYVDPNGLIDTVAGGGSDFGQPDGVQALTVHLFTPVAVTVGADGALFVVERHGTESRVRKIDPNGIITSAAGGESGLGDGGPATAANLWNAEDVALGADGSLYIADRSNNRIRRVATDGIITTVAGNGDGSLDGIPGKTQDGVLATTTTVVQPMGVAVGSDGSLYILEASPSANRLRRVDPAGIITTLAGAQEDGYAGDGGRAALALFDTPEGLAVRPDGALVIADTENHRLRRIDAALPWLEPAEFFVAAEDGSEAYIFDADGRHRRTRSTLTGEVLSELEYEDGYLTAITDVDGKVTTIDRDGSGTPEGITAPYGQVTTFTLDGNGYFANITDPNTDAREFVYTPQGLMTTLRTPKDDEYTFTYYADGRLQTDDDPAGGSKTLEREPPVPIPASTPSS